jgi:hypothetical protein
MLILFEITEMRSRCFLEVERRFGELAFSSTNPEIQPLGSEMDVILELKVLADVGLVVFQMQENIAVCTDFC